MQVERHPLFRTEFEGKITYEDNYSLNFYHTFDEMGNSIFGLKRSEINFKENKWAINPKRNRKNKVIVHKAFDSIFIEDIIMDNEKTEVIKLSGKLADSTYKALISNSNWYLLRKYHRTSIN